MVSRALFLGFSLLSLGVEASEMEGQVPSHSLPTVLTTSQKQRCVEIIQLYSEKSLTEDTKSWTHGAKSQELLRGNDMYSIQFDERNPMNFLEQVIRYADSMEEFHKHLAASITEQNCKIVVQMAFDVFCGRSPGVRIEDIH